MASLSINTHFRSPLPSFSHPLERVPIDLHPFLCEDPLQVVNAGDFVSTFCHIALRSFPQRIIAWMQVFEGHWSFVMKILRGIRGMGGGSALHPELLLRFFESAHYRSYLRKDFVSQQFMMRILV